MRFCQDGNSSSRKPISIIKFGVLGVCWQSHPGFFGGDSSPIEGSGCVVVSPRSLTGLSRLGSVLGALSGLFVSFGGSPACGSVAASVALGS